jgi:hypothetical protein
MLVIGVTHSVSFLEIPVPQDLTARFSRIKEFEYYPCIPFYSMVGVVSLYQAIGRSL